MKNNRDSSIELQITPGSWTITYAYTVCSGCNSSCLYLAGKNQMVQEEAQNKMFGINLQQLKIISNLRFADDIDLVVEDTGQLQELTD